jgi:hypothetical protein
MEEVMTMLQPGGGDDNAQQRLRRNLGQPEKREQVLIRVGNALPAQELATSTKKPSNDDIQFDENPG